MDRRNNEAAAAGGSGTLGEGTSRPTHRKCMSDTFAFVAGQADGSSGLSGDFLDEQDELGLDSEECDKEMMHALLDMDNEDERSEDGGKGAKAGRSGKAKKAAVPATSGGDDYSEDGDGKDDGDPKRAKRIMANRQSAQRSRQRKLQYTSDLEKSVTRLHTEISQLNPQLVYLRTQHQEYSARNRDLRARITALLQETQYKDQMNNSLRDQVLRMKKAPGAAGGGTGQQQPGQAAPGPGGNSAMMMGAGQQQLMGLHQAQMTQSLPGANFAAMPAPQQHQHQQHQHQQRQHQQHQQHQQQQQPPQPPQQQPQQLAGPYGREPGSGMGESLQMYN